MIKKIIVLTTLVLGFTVYSQEGGSSSPYSFFGIGLQQFRGTVENEAMGGLSLYSDSLHLNIINPAQLGKLRFVTFTVGGGNSTTTFRENDIESTGTNTTFDYFALGFPISKKGGVSFGLMPWTSAGYDIDASEGAVINTFSGNGGVNRAFISNGYEVSKGLYLGATAAIYFGNIQNSVLRLQEEVELGTREANRADFSGLSWEFGAQYEKKISEKLEVRTSVQYSTASIIRVQNSRTVSSVVFSNIGLINDLDTQEAEIQDTDFSLPSSVTIGLGIGEDRKWFLGGEFKQRETSNFFNNSFRTTRASFIDSKAFTVGGFYIPNYNSITSYFERITYRAGARYEELGLRITNEDITEFGISFGVGLPARRNISNLNVTFEYGQRGTTEANLVQEDFFNIGISLSLNDIWFQKRKFN